MNLHEITTFKTNLSSDAARVYKHLRAPFNLNCYSLAFDRSDKTEEIFNSVTKRSRSKTQEIKQTLFNWTKEDKTCTFSRKSSFSS